MPFLPSCPLCQSEFTYKDGTNLVCPECAHEWSMETPAGVDESRRIVRDAHGNELNDGDTVTLIKDLKVKGANQTLKQGTIIRSIRLTDNPEEIDCKYDAIKGLVLRTEFVRKR